MVGAFFPTLLVVWLEISQHWRLQATGWDKVQVGTCSFQEGHQLVLPGILLPVSFLPQWATATHHLHRSPSSATRKVDPVLLQGHFFFPLLSPGLHENLEAPSNSGVSDSPGLWNSYDKTLMIFKARFSGVSSSYYQIPNVSFRTLDSAGELLWLG